MVRLKAKQIDSWKDRIQGFNSTMVRLKDELPVNAPTADSGFNSTMVRLKGPGDDHALSIKIMFQFHNGSIKSDIFDLIPQRRAARFNSTMVRLKVRV